MPALSNYKYEIFARHVSTGMPNKEAAKKADLYKKDSPKSDHNLLSNISSLPIVAQRIQELRDIAAARTTITSARILEEIAKIGFANMMDYVKIQEDGSGYIDLKDMDRDKAAAISEIVVDEYVEGRGEDARQVKRVRLKLHDKRAALVDMGKHLGMFSQRVEVTGKDGGPIQHANKMEVSLLSRDEREMLKQLLLLAAERKRSKELGLESPTIEASTIEASSVEVSDNE